MTNRKATDVLLSIEEKVITLNKKYDNLEFMLKKLLSNKTDKVTQNIEKNIVNNDKPVAATKPLMPGLKPGVVMGPHGLYDKGEENSDNILDDPIEVSENVNASLRRTNRVSNRDQLKGVPVKQKVLYPDGKLVCLANVEVFDVENKLVSKMRTNALGIWMASLSPGQYNVKINKSKAGNKPEVNFDFNVDIPVSDGPLELSSPE